jgi:hypothetical protein
MHGRIPKEKDMPVKEVNRIRNSMLSYIDKIQALDRINFRDKSNGKVGRSILVRNVKNCISNFKEACSLDLRSDLGNKSCRFIEKRYGISESDQVQLMWMFSISKSHEYLFFVDLINGGGLVPSSANFLKSIE